MKVCDCCYEPHVGFGGWAYQLTIPDDTPCRGDADAGKVVPHKTMEALGFHWTGWKWEDPRRRKLAPSTTA